MQVLKVEVPDIELLREKLWDLSFLLVVACCPGSGVYGKIVSCLLLPSSVWFSSHLPEM